MFDSHRLKECQLCRGLDESELAELASIASRRNVSRGEIIFLEGDPAGGFFLLISGKVRVYKSSPDGREYTIHIIRPGQLFAEAAIFRGHHFPANCSALEDSEVVFFPKEDFTALLKQSPQISLKIIGALAAFVRDFTRQVEDLSLKEVPSRIASYLLDKYETTGRKEIILDISKSELASHLGTISETLSRKLTFLKELGAIRGDGPAITLMDIPLLRKIADGRKI